MPHDNRQLTIRIRLRADPTGQLPGPPWQHYLIALEGARDGEECGLILSFYDGADPAGEARPGDYHVREYTLASCGVRALQLSVRLPSEHSGFAVREARAGGWALPYVVIAGEAPGATGAGAGLPQG